MLKLDDDLRNWLRDVLPKRSGKRIAQRVAGLQGLSRDHSLISKILRDERQMRAIDLLLLERLTKTDFPTLMRVEVKAIIDESLIGRKPPRIRKVSAPRGATRSTKAVRVSSNILSPLISPGSILFYSQMLPVSQLVGRCAFVEMPHGDIIFGVVAQTSKDEFRLADIPRLSKSDTSKSVIDHPSPALVVTMAAPVDWIKPG